MATGQASAKAEFDGAKRPETDRRSRRRPERVNTPKRFVAMCLGPEAGGGFEIREVPRRSPAPDEIEVAVEAASVNPIDVRRAEGYGRSRARGGFPPSGRAKRKSDQCFALASHRGSRSGKQPDNSQTRRSAVKCLRSLRKTSRQGLVAQGRVRKP